MRAEIRHLFSPDIVDLAEHTPEDPTKFSYLLQVLVGPEDGPGEESFDVIVCSPRWLDEAALPDSKSLLARHHLIQKRYDWSEVESFIGDYVRHSDADTWDEIAARLSRLGHWEFEDFDNPDPR